MLDWNDVIIWQIISAFIGTMMIALTFLLIIITRKKKELAYHIVGVYPLMDDYDYHRGKININFDRKKIEYITVINLKIINTGNIPILENDFIEPILIDFGNDAEIIDIIKELKPSNMKIKLSHTKNSINLLPILLNGSDSIFLKILLNNYKYSYDNLMITTRIIDIKKIKDITKKQTFIQEMIES